MAKAKGKKTPSGIKYEQSHPTIAFRAPKELYDRLQAAKKVEGKSNTDVMKIGVGILEVKMRSEGEIRREWHRKGYELAESIYKLTFPCFGCGEMITQEAQRYDETAEGDHPAQGSRQDRLHSIPLSM